MHDLSWESDILEFRSTVPVFDDIIWYWGSQKKQLTDKDIHNELMVHQYLKAKENMAKNTECTKITMEGSNRTAIIT